MSLFQKSVEKKYLSELDTSLIEKKFIEFKSYFGNAVIQENIRNSKEEQFQEGFLRELFVKILGYTLNPDLNFNLTTELKNISNARKADGAILKGADAIAVIELKSSDTTDLGSVESQAFGYKNHHPKCIYIITSNFEKLRFYIQNAVEYLEFDLFALSKEQFSLLWLCLAKDKVLSDVPLKIKESSVLQEENITKKLYADYSRFREAIYNNLVKNNPDKDKLLLFKKTQKLLDRFLFIFFAEDRLLVPPNSISQIIEKWKDDMDFGDKKPLYSIFKQYFHVLNIGRPKSGIRQEIFAYNGGLFLPDEILDNVSIDDEILFEHTVKLSTYDFETEVDVNILGHIFEHSLGEIENVQAEIKGEQVDQQKTRRKKDGIFYTPKYITKYIVENTVGKLCSEKRNELEIIDEEYAKGRKNRKKETIKALDEKLIAYRNWMLSLTILDPACGSGAFLNQALEFLIKEHHKIDELRAQLFGSSIIFSDITTDILEKNIYGVDLNEESVEIAKLSLWLRTAQKGRKLNALNNNIKCGNSLIDDPEVAGDKAFNWYKEFPHIFVKKNKKAWHLTFVLHNSRYADNLTAGTDGSTRQFYRKKEAGYIAPTYPELSVQEQEILAVELGKAAKDYNLNILECNICSDHVHSILVCEEEELSILVGKWKGRTAFTYNRRVNPSVDEKPAIYADGTKEKFWAKSFHPVLIETPEQFENTINYIRNNRIKHNMSIATDGLTRQLKEITCTYQHAFRDEYKGGFDVVIGNPPYVRAELLGFCRSHLEKNYSVFNPSGDLFSYFYEKSFNLLKEKIGLFGFISNTFDKTTAGVTIREYLQSKVLFIKYIDFTEVQIFEGATTYPVIIIAKKYIGKQNVFNYIKIPKADQAPVIDIDFHSFVQVAQSNLNNENWSFISNQGVNLIEKLKNNKSIKEIYEKSYRGILTGLNEAFIIPKSFQQSAHIKPVFEGKEIEKWTTPDSVQQLILFESKWTKLNYGNDITEEKALEKLKNDFLDLMKHILQFEERAKMRFDKGDFFWELRNCAYYDLFEKPKIVFPNLQNSNKFSYDETGSYINAPAVIMPTEDKFLVAILNSKIVWYFLTSICVVRSGGYIEVKPQYFEQIPIAEIPENIKIQLTELTNQIIANTKQTHGIKTKFIKILSNKFENINITKKLDNWYDLSFPNFQKELLKQKIKLLLIDEAEWMDFFEVQSKQYSNLKNAIKTHEKEIDQMVYQLYGLTEEEIRIVEEAVK